MERQGERELQILTAIEEGEPLTQRALAERLDVALGLCNLYLKRLVRKGYIKIVEFPKKPAARKRLRYLLTPRGMAEKTRLTYEHMAYSLHLYRRARQRLSESLGRLSESGAKRIALYGTGEAAELAYLTLKELGLDPMGVCAPHADGPFLGFPVRALADLAGEEFDVIIVATFERPEEPLMELLSRGVLRERILTLRQPLAAAPGRESRPNPPAKATTKNAKPFFRIPFSPSTIEASTRASAKGIIFSRNSRVCRTKAVNKGNSRSASGIPASVPITPSRTACTPRPFASRRCAGIRFTKLSSSGRPRKTFGRKSKKLCTTFMPRMA